MNVQNPITKVRLRAAARADKSFGAALADAAPCHADAQASGATSSRNPFMRKPNHSPLRTHSGNDGFTLIELLVVVAIIIVLAAITITVFRNVTASAHRATCVGILRQYAVAFTGYLGDHQNTMPNIQVNLQNPSYRDENGNHIYAAIFPYLGLEPQSKATALPDNLVCPAWRKRFPNWNSDGSGTKGGNVYFLNNDQTINNKRIFGTQANHNPSSPYGGMNYALAINGTKQTPASRIIFLKDGHHPTEGSDPVHGQMRNYLFLDFHVESRPASDVIPAPSP
jgi:prepilin-type N-terminal cleavage/methylation domain-containing protein/prepilin-type processing-associated H-X9-DG protein